MSKKLTANMPSNVNAGANWIIRWRAIDPTTGANVSTVVVSNVNVDGDAAGSTSRPTQQPPWQLVPGSQA